MSGPNQNETKIVDKIEKLHEDASKLSSKDLILGLAAALLRDNLNPKAILILKTYLYRALQKEGIR